MAELEGNLSIPGEKERFLEVAETIRDHIGADPVAREDLRENPVGKEHGSEENSARPPWALSDAGPEKKDALRGT